METRLGKVPLTARLDHLWALCAVPTYAQETQQACPTALLPRAQWVLFAHPLAQSLLSRRVMTRQECACPCPAGAQTWGCSRGLAPVLCPSLFSVEKSQNQVSSECVELPEVGGRWAGPRALPCRLCSSLPVRLVLRLHHPPALSFIPQCSWGL